MTLTLEVLFFNLRYKQLLLYLNAFLTCIFSSIVASLHWGTVVYPPQISHTQGRDILKRTLVRKSKYFFCSQGVLASFKSWLWALCQIFLSALLSALGAFVLQLCCLLNLVLPFLFVSPFLHVSPLLSLPVVCLCFLPWSCKEPAPTEGGEPGRAVLLQNEEGY